MEKRYEKPTVLATYSAEELAEEAALCGAQYQPDVTMGTTT
jgi:hypothetical protein